MRIGLKAYLFLSHEERFHRLKSDKRRIHVLLESAKSQRQAIGCVGRNPVRQVVALRSTSHKVNRSLMTDDGMTTRTRLSCSTSNNSEGSLRRQQKQ